MRLPSAGGIGSVQRVSRVVQIGQQMDEIQDGDESQMKQVHFVDRPVISLAVADTRFSFRYIQSAAMHFGGHLPAEGFAVGHRGHHRAQSRGAGSLSARSLSAAS